MCNRNQKKTACKLKLSFLTAAILFSVLVYAQKPTPPIPVELLAGNKELYYQMVIKRPFSSESKFDIFGLATYSANYVGDVADNRVIIITQMSYKIAKGFGIMAGTDINSFSGFSPIVGPQHNFSNSKILAVTVASFFLNEDKDFKLFGLYEYKPKINEQWAFYSRLQFIYNHSLQSNSHNVSYVYLRAGLKRKSFIFGAGANVDWAGPNRFFSENYGAFVRWEFQ